MPNRKLLTDAKSLSDFITCRFTSDNWVILSPIQRNIKRKIEERGTPLKKWNIRIDVGFITGCNEAFIVDSSTKDVLIAEDPKSEEIIKPVVKGRYIKRYGYDFMDLHVIIMRKGVDLEAYPSIKTHLTRYRETLNKKSGVNAWYEFVASPSDKKMECFAKPKLIYSEIVQEPQFFYDKEGAFYPDTTTYSISGERLPFLCGLVHSKAVTYAFKSFYAGGGLGERGYRYNKEFLLNLPIPAPTETEEKAITSLVTRRLQETDPVKQLAIEKEINTQVYALYGLADDEITLIENHNG